MSHKTLSGNMKQHSLDQTTQEEIGREQLKLLFASLDSSLRAAFLSGLAFCVILIASKANSPIFLILWLVALSGSLLYRLHVKSRFDQVAAGLFSIGKWKRQFLYGVCFSASVWGSTAFLFFTSDSMQIQVFHIFILAGVIGGAVGTLSPSLSAINIFVIITMVPLSVRMMLTGTPVGVTMGGLMLVYVQVIRASGRRFNQSIKENFLLRCEAQQRETKLHESEEKYRLLFEKSEEPMMLLFGARFNMANQAAVKLLGFTSEEEFLNTIPAKISAPVQLNGKRKKRETLKMLRRAYDDGYNRFEWLCQKTDGSIFPADVSLTRIPFEGKDALFFLVHDISKSKEVEQHLIKAQQQADKANRAKSAFLANMSHELRTPLNVILGYTQLFARDSSLAPKHQNGITSIHNSGEHLLMLINDILDLSKIEAGKMELAPKEFSLPGFLQGIAKTFKFKADEKGLDFIYEPENIFPVIVETDELRLRQVCLNLLSNAVKFTEHGHCILRVQAELIDADWLRLTVSVEDNGVGVAPGMQEQIFKPFQQTGDPLQHAEGSGLGLAISSKLIQLLGGTLDVVSPVNEQTGEEQEPGSRFSFTVKIAVTSSMAVADVKKRKVTGYHGSDEHNGNKNILIVDDVASNRAVLRATLEPLGFIIVEADSGSEALAACEQAQPDLILMDLLMPELDGFATTKLVKEHQGFSHIPVIALTALTDKMDTLKQRCLEHGFDDLVPKPYSISELLKILARHLKVELDYIEDSSADPIDISNIVAPPLEILEGLISLAQSGDIGGVVRLNKEITGMESGKYSVFAHLIEQLADDFQLIEIEKFITKHLN